jgi:hypothetical protein
MTALIMTPGAAKSGARDRVQKTVMIVEKNRVQLEFAPRSMERLNALKTKTEAASCAEVVHNALRLYESPDRRNRGRQAVPHTRPERRGGARPAVSVIRPRPKPAASYWAKDWLRTSRA